MKLEYDIDNFEICDSYENKLNSSLNKGFNGLF